MDENVENKRDKYKKNQNVIYTVYHIIFMYQCILKKMVLYL